MPRNNAATRIVLLLLFVFLLARGNYAATPDVDYRQIADIPYASFDDVDPSLTSLDIYVPVFGQDHPVVVWVHGGGWRGGDKGQVDIKSEAFVAEGYLFASINYRLSPEVIHPTHVQDVASAIAWLYRNIADYGGNPDALFLIGHSAGAHLVALVSTDERYLNAEGLSLGSLKGIVCLDGAGYDISASMDDGPLLAMLCRQAFGDDPVVWEDASPITHVEAGKDIPPFLLIHAGDRQASREAASAFGGRLEEAGVEVSFFHASNKTHSSLNKDLGKPGDKPTASVFGFLSEIQTTLVETASDRSVILSNVEYARVNGTTLKLDLYLPPHALDESLPLVVWIHGGGWRGGDKFSTQAPRVLGGDFAVASINYRLSQVATFPAQVYDCKAAIRFLRANAGRYGFDPERIGVWGSSAGGHLSALLGTSGDIANLEGDVGAYLDQSSRVQAVCDYYGPTDFVALLEQQSRLDRVSLRSPEALLLGGTIAENPERAQAASPITYVSFDDPPFLIIHGDADPTVPIGQSELLHAALLSAGVQSLFHVVEGAGHGFRDPTVDLLVRRFFTKHLLQEEE